MKKFFLKMLIRQEYLLEKLDIRSKAIMAKIEDVEAGIQAVLAAAAAEKVEVKGRLDELSAQITDLAAQLANGASPTQLDTIVTELNDAAAQISGIYDASGSVPPADSGAGDQVPADTDVPPADSGDAPTEGDGSSPQPVLP